MDPSSAPRIAAIPLADKPRPGSAASRQGSSSPHRLDAAIPYQAGSLPRLDFNRAADAVGDEAAFVGAAVERVD
jgi:hypothetical protein